VATALNNHLHLVEEHDLLDEFEAGELAVELDDKEPQEVIAWTLDRFGDRAAVCTSFQNDGMAILDMAWRIDPKVRVFAVDTGRMHQETYDLIDRVRERYDMNIEIYYPDAKELATFVSREGINPFYRSVPLRLRCCEIRKVNPLLKVLDGLDAWITGLRRDQWASRSNIRKVEIDGDHGGIAKVNPLADWTEEEVWEVHSRERRSLQRALRPGLHQHWLRALHSADQRRRRQARWPLVVGKKRAERVRHSLPARDWLVRARDRVDPRPPRAPRVTSGDAAQPSATATRPALRLSAAEQELLAPEVRAFATVHPQPSGRQRYEALASTIEAGGVPEDSLDDLARVLEIGLQSGRVRRVYGADGEMALGRIYQRTPRGAEATGAAAAVTRALEALRGQVIDEVRVTALGPGAYSILLDTRQCQITVRLDRSGVRVDNVALGV
jgi:phosphoadenylyl-sulfate reductase (thioredoxin)